MAPARPSFTSSNADWPTSLTTSRPVPGWTAKLNGFRSPTAQMARFAPVVVPLTPGNAVGLSAGIDPSGLRRRSLPRRLDRLWLLAGSAFSPTATYSLPSAPNPSAPPLWLVAADSGSRSSSTRWLPATAASPATVNRLTRLNGAAPPAAGTVW